MLEENYNHLDIEDKIYTFWESNKLFEPKKNNKKKYFSIVIPPPNVTGNLHMGHALNNSIQDLLDFYISSNVLQEQNYINSNSNNNIGNPVADHAPEPVSDHHPLIKKVGQNSGYIVLTHIGNFCHTL